MEELQLWWEFLSLLDLVSCNESRFPIALSKTTSWADPYQVSGVSWNTWTNCEFLKGSCRLFDLIFLDFSIGFWTTTTLTGHFHLNGLKWLGWSSCMRLISSSSSSSIFFSLLTSEPPRSLPGNELSGPLPASWNGLFNLFMLHLQRNNLTGPLPSEWSNMTRLASLYVTCHPFLPFAWNNLRARSLSRFHFIRDLASNNLDGTLPSNWGSPSTLKIL